MGRTFATLYDEVVSEWLYAGKTQLNRSLTEPVTEAETVLNFTCGFRKRTILHIDGSNDAGINWILSRDYLPLVKMTQWKRVNQLTTPVSQWYTTILAFNLQDEQLAWLCQQGKYPITLPQNLLW